MKNTYNNNNIFAKILRKEIPSIRVYEDNNTLAFLDKTPKAHGHTLVIPRKAYRNLFDADPETLAYLIQTVQKIAKAVKTAFLADGITLMQFNEAASGQTIYHLHFHIIPRLADLPLITDPITLEEAAQKIRLALQNL
ncbi:MAG: histidine triad (HIT) family protein [Candidatus Tokpelaia sp. JSC161]|jgi:histidine triad (HIT) family protein|nr:MAG: histidine triad (HIT) family protein [Candidatus Tokpelaia sp. JSC161]